jgi:hypothetical protein
LVCEKITPVTAVPPVATAMMEIMSDVTAVLKLQVAIKGSEFTATCFRNGDAACST